MQPATSEYATCSIQTLPIHSNYCLHDSGQPTQSARKCTKCYVMTHKLEICKYWHQPWDNCTCLSHLHTVPSRCVSVRWFESRTCYYRDRRLQSESSLPLSGQPVWRVKHMDCKHMHMQVDKFCTKMWMKVRQQKQLLKEKKKIHKLAV